MADSDLRLNLEEVIATKPVSSLPDTNAGGVDDMTPALTDILLWTAANISLPIRRKQ